MLIADRTFLGFRLQLFLFPIPYFRMSEKLKIVTHTGYLSEEKAESLLLLVTLSAGGR
jgi:hypothetical protein